MSSVSEPWPSWVFVSAHSDVFERTRDALSFLLRSLSAPVSAFRCKCPSRDSWALSWRVICVAAGLIYVLQGIQAQWVLLNVLQGRLFSAEEMRCQIENLQRGAPFDTELERMLRIMTTVKVK